MGREARIKLARRAHRRSGEFFGLAEGIAEAALFYTTLTMKLRKRTIRRILDVPRKRHK